MSSPHLFRYAAPSIVRIYSRSSAALQSTPTTSLLRTIPSKSSATFPRSSIRFASSLPSASTPPSSYDATPGTLPPGYDIPFDPPLDPSSIASVTPLNPETFTPYIGYLKEVYSLDFGWGPTSLLQWLIEHVQVYTGLPWWANFTLTAVLVRVSMAKLYLNSTDTIARMQQLKPKIEPLQKQMKAAQQAGDQQGLMASQKEIKTMYNLAGIKLSRAFIPFVAQGMLGYGTFRLTRNMATENVVGLSNGGIFSFTDLTIPDPTYLLPLAGAVISYRIAVLNQKQQPPTSDTMAAMQPVLQYVMPLFFCGFLSFQAAVTQIPMIVAIALQYPQTVLLGAKSWRQRLGLPLLAHQMEESPGGTNSQKPIPLLIKAKAPAIHRPADGQTTNMMQHEPAEEKSWVQTQLAKPRAAIGQSLAGPRKAIQKSADVTKAKYQQMVGQQTSPDGKKSKLVMRQEKKLEADSKAREEMEADRRQEDRARRREDREMEKSQKRMRRQQQQQKKQATG